MNDCVKMPSFMGFGEAPIKMEGGIADPDEFVWECNCEACQVRYTEWKAAFDIEQKELRERGTHDLGLLNRQRAQQDFP